MYKTSSFTKRHNLLKVVLPFTGVVEKLSLTFPAYPTHPGRVNGAELGARSNVNRSGCGGCRLRPPPQVGHPSSSSFSLLLASGSSSRPVWGSRQHGPAGFLKRLPLTRGRQPGAALSAAAAIGRRGTASPAPPSSPLANESGGSCRPRLAIGWRPCQSGAIPAAGCGGREEATAGSVRAGEWGRAVAALRLRHLSGAPVGGEGAPEPRSLGREWRRSSSSAESPCELIPAQAAAPAPHEATASAPGRVSEQRVCPRREAAAPGASPLAAGERAGGGSRRRSGARRM